jgi:hypothetical protein
MPLDSSLGRCHYHIENKGVYPIILCLASGDRFPTVVPLIQECQPPARVARFTEARNIRAGRVEPVGVGMTLVLAIELLGWGPEDKLRTVSGCVRGRNVLQRRLVAGRT